MNFRSFSRWLKDAWSFSSLRRWNYGWLRLDLSWLLVSWLCLTLRLAMTLLETELADLNLFFGRTKLSSVNKLKSIFRSLSIFMTVWLNLTIQLESSNYTSAGKLPVYSNSTFTFFGYYNFVWSILFKNRDFDLWFPWRVLCRKMLLLVAFCSFIM